MFTWTSNLYFTVINRQQTQCALNWKYMNNDVLWLNMNKISILISLFSLMTQFHLYFRMRSITVKINESVIYSYLMYIYPFLYKVSLVRIYNTFIYTGTLFFSAITKKCFPLFHIIKDISLLFSLATSANKFLL